jgi:hypothetical protein
MTDTKNSRNQYESRKIGRVIERIAHRVEDENDPEPGGSE